ncbi:MAG TPA: hypothetical protein VGK33_02090 [Chloroflexota bacterium]|jgi:hypothetical protein
MQRPTGVTIIALIIFVSGALHFLGAFLAFSSGSILSAQAKSGYYVPMATPLVNAFGNLGFSIGLVGMILAVITLVAAGGLWVLSRTWGFWLATVILVLDLIADVVDLMAGNITWFHVLGALFAIVALIYLWQPKTREVFAGYPIDAPAS